MELRFDNPYAYGKLIDFGDGEEQLLRAQFAYNESQITKTHTIKEGDTLSNLAGKEYGNSKLWWLIADVNGDIITNPLELEVGKVIIIPNKNTIFASNV